MAPPVLTMSRTEFQRAVLLRKVDEKRLTQAKAAEILGLSLRQIERLCRRYRNAGPSALASRQRGQPSNHRLSCHFWLAPIIVPSKSSIQVLRRALEALVVLPAAVSPVIGGRPVV